MNPELAIHISLLASHIYAAALIRRPNVSLDNDRIRSVAIQEAIKLWIAVLEVELPSRPDEPVMAERGTRLFE